MATCNRECSTGRGRVSRHDALATQSASASAAALHAHPAPTGARAVPAYIDQY